MEDNDRATEFNGLGSDTFTVTVNNVPPVVTGLPATFVHNLLVDQLVATYSDAGFLDAHEATIDWGDGTSESGAVNQTTNSVSGLPHLCR